MLAWNAGVGLIESSVATLSRRATVCGRWVGWWLQCAFARSGGGLSVRPPDRSMGARLCCGDGSAGPTSWWSTAELFGLGATTYARRRGGFRVLDAPAASEARRGPRGSDGPYPPPRLDICFDMKQE
ncbi:hypothetical protein Aab01nite_35900 [Paractinoplanes abujensis]|nr:hypothetical protein Aab01nite_35900 [Actinoplanes abujensis]